MKKVKPKRIEYFDFKKQQWIIWHEGKEGKIIIDRRANTQKEVENWRKEKKFEIKKYKKKDKIFIDLFEKRQAQENIDKILKTYDKQSDEDQRELLKYLKKIERHVKYKRDQVNALTRTEFKKGKGFYLGVPVFYAMQRKTGQNFWLAKGSWKYIKKRIKDNGEPYYVIFKSKEGNEFEGKLKKSDFKTAKNFEKAINEILYNYKNVEIDWEAGKGKFLFRWLT